MIYHGDCLDILHSELKFDMIFMDPPDNIGLDYENYDDNRPADDYYLWLSTLLRKALWRSDCIWLSYYHKHDLEIKHIIRGLVKFQYTGLEVRTFIWRFTFGQYRDSDCASGYRPMVRLLKPGASVYPQNVRVPSRRMEIGDSRAAGPRVPDDVWEFPRVVGNAGERRPWHNTQHPEALMERVIGLSTKVGDSVLDCFAGTGTTLRVCQRMDRRCLSAEISEEYCRKISEEVGDYPCGL